MNRTKKIIIGEVILIIGILIYLFFSTAPLQIYPLHGMTIIEPDFAFEIENGEQVLISIDKNFTAPIVLDKSSEITLTPGTYYWKVRSNFRESGVKNFTIQGYVALNIKERDESYRIANKGNVDLNVTKKNEGVTSNIILDIGESEEVEKDDSIYQGGQKWNLNIYLLF